MSIRVHQPLVWYMTNKHAAGYVGLFKGPEMEALERRGSFSCPGVTPCQPRWQHSLAWVRSALSNKWWYTRAYTSKRTHAGTHRMYVNACKFTHIYYFAATMWMRHDKSASVSNNETMMVHIHPHILAREFKMELHLYTNLYYGQLLLELEILWSGL